MGYIVSHTLPVFFYLETPALIFGGSSWDLRLLDCHTVLLSHITIARLSRASLGLPRLLPLGKPP